MSNPPAVAPHEHQTNRNAGNTNSNDSLPKSVADEWRTNALSRLTWWWLGPLLALGYKRPLEFDDLGALAHEDRAGALADKLERYLALSPSAPMVSRFWHALLVHEPIMIIAAVAKLIGDLLGFVGPISLSGIVRHVTLAYVGAPAEEWHGLEMGWWWLIALFVSSILQNLCLHQHHHHAIRAGMHLRSAITVSVYRKALRIGPSQRAEFGAGAIQNLASTDSNSINMLYWFIHYSWAAPLQLAICMAMLYAQLGPSSFIAVGVLILLIPVQGKIAGLTGRFTKETLVHTDARVKLINEIVTGIRVIKFMAWEEFFKGRVLKARTSELRQKRNVALIRGCNNALQEAGPLVVALLSFLVYAYTSDQPLTAVRAFTSLSLFNILRLPLMLIPMLVGTIVSAKVSVTRLSKFFALPDMPEYRTTLPAAAPAAGGADEKPAAIELKSATLSWNEPQSKKVKEVDGAAQGKDAVAVKVVDEDPFILDSISLAFPAGKLTSVVGAVGSGKSSLLSAILGEMCLREGSVILRVGSGGAPTPTPAAEDTNSEGTTTMANPLHAKSASSSSSASAIAYCSQQPWILNSSLKENIIFGEPLDEARYERTVDACALRPDLAILPAGDATEIGERGVNLSGGQKARVALARAVYSKSRIVLLDDVLSAVDAHVAKHLHEQAIAGMLKGRTVILVSHQLQFIPQSDLVVVMAGGRVSQIGSYDSLMAVAEGEAEGSKSNLLRAMMGERTKIEGGLAAAQVSAENGEQKEAATASTPLADTPAAAPPAPAAAPAAAAAAAAPSTTTTTAITVAAPSTAVKGKLITEEDRLRGTVPLSVYGRYSLSYGPVTLALLITFLLIVSGGRIGTDWWLGLWSVDSLHNTVPFYVGVYGAITAGTALFSFCYEACWAFGGVHAALHLHSSMFERILRSPISFFDTTPVGRILNRFSSDIATVDKDLPTSFSSFVTLSFRILGTLVVQAVIMPWTLIGTIPIAILYIAVQQYYRHTSRELKRLDAISKSPVYAHLSESLAGTATIRSYAQGPRFVHTSESKADLNVRAYWKSNLVNRWLGLRLDWIGSLLVGCIGLVAVLTSGSLSPGLAGLCLSYSLAVTGLLNWLVRGATETETYLASVERIEYYAALPVERAPVIAGALPTPAWPEKGSISVKELSVRYREDLEPVLKAASFEIAGGHRVGVCGRTGSGKSSLMLALFRMLEAESGSISIDGLDISKVGLDDLRSRLAIIPQDPTLFSGPLRYNLDPTGTTSDAELWEALEAVQLGPAVRSLGGLDAKLTEGGENMSVGQRQLVCMSRALLRRSKVLVLDEATASVDVQTDALIQGTIRKVFAGTTVLTIAHRVHTILDSDVVLVLDGGKVAEFGSPAELLQQQEGFFAQLVKNSSMQTAASGSGGAGAAAEEAKAV